MIISMSGRSAAWQRTCLGDKGSQVQILSSRPIETMSYKVRNSLKRGNKRKHRFRDTTRDTNLNHCLIIPHFKSSATAAGQDSKIVIRADVAQLVEQLIRNE